MNAIDAIEILEIPRDCALPVSAGTACGATFDITPECIETDGGGGGSGKIDFESGASLANAFFIIVMLSCITTFLYQISEGLFELNGVDPNNFTFRHSNWGDSGNAHGIFTSIFLHGSADHLIGNLLFLFPLSLVIHKLYGTLRGLAIFMGLGIVAGLATYHIHG